MRTAIIIICALVLSTINTEVQAQKPKPFMDSLHHIIGNLRVPYEVHRDKKSVMGFILVQLSQKLAVQQLSYSKSLPPVVTQELDKAKPRLSKLSWTGLFPVAERRATNYILIPYWIGTDPKTAEKLTVTDLWKLFSEAVEIKQLQKASSMVMTEPVKVEMLYRFDDGSSK